jgi:hypothetical protein
VAFLSAGNAGDNAMILPTSSVRFGYPSIFARP